MKKNTQFVSVLVGLGSLMALFTVLSNNGGAKFTPREEVNNNAQTEANFEFFNVMRANVNTGKVETTDYLKAVEASRKFQNSRATGLNWNFMGPDNIGGRARAIVVDNSNSNIIYAGGAGGGMYISTDAAGTWTYKSTGWENIHVSTIAQDANGRIYAGTGMYADDYPGGGIWVSDDRGATWSHLASTTPSPNSTSDTWAYINRIAVSKRINAQGNYSVFAATKNGLKVSLDNGLTWIFPLTLPSPNCSNKLPGNVQDVVTTPTGRVLVAYNGGLYMSDNGEVICSYSPVTIVNGIGGSTRMSLAVCANDENVVYAFQGSGPGGENVSFKILKSSDGGHNWGDLQPAPPTPVIDSTFDLMGVNPSRYNQAIVVDPTDCDKIYVGAVEMYRVAGAWTSIAVNFNIPGIYVHADKHWFTYDPSDPNTMYVGTDGGVAKTTNAAAANVTWTENNRHFGTTQYYGVATTKYGQVLGGTQDNGTHLIDPSLTGPSGRDGLEVFGGDGFDCDASNISDVAIVTSQYGAVGRGSFLSGGSDGGMIHPAGRPGSPNTPSPFYTIVREWESDNDITSLDSVVFVNDTLRFPIGTGDGNITKFFGTLRKLQNAAKIVPGQVTFADIAGGQVATDSDVLGVLKSFGDSIGTINYNTGEFQLRWSFAPPLGSSINSVFNVKFNTGDTLNLVSQNQLIPFDYVLPFSLFSTDSIIVQDPVQSLVVVSMYGSVDITREALYYPLQSPGWGKISIPEISNPTSFEFSSDGDVLYVGGYMIQNNTFLGGRVVRISGLNQWYHGTEPDSIVTKTRIYSGSSSVSGLCLHPTDEERLLITTSGYGVSNHVYELTAALSATSTGSALKRALQGDLPDMPVYDPEYNVNNTDQVLLGTELGLWVCDDITVTSGQAWTQQSGAMGNVPVLDVRQQRLPFGQASNYGRFYLGTFGRGIWTTSDLVGIDDTFADFSNDEEISNLKLYPNPVKSVSKLSFDIPVSGSVKIMIYDISGKLIIGTTKHYSQGTAEFSINSNNMPAGTYFVTVGMGDTKSRTKFVVIK